MAINTHCRLQDPAHIFDLAQRLAAAFPTRENILIGLYELLLNAIEHGNLQIDKQEKIKLLRNGTLNHEIARRLALPENADKWVEIEVATVATKSETITTITIRDQGNGFDWQHYMLPLTQTEDDLLPCGRGILIARQCDFDSLTFNDKGNEVRCSIKAPK